MKVQINFKIINPDYDQQYADEYHFGEESVGNWKYRWAVAYRLDKVDSVELIDNEDFLLRGTLNDGNAVEFRIPDTLIYRCHLQGGGREDFAVSKSILYQTHEAKKAKYRTVRFYFYINPVPPSIHLVNSLVVDERHVPEELLIKT